MGAEVAAPKGGSGDATQGGKLRVSWNILLISLLAHSCRCSSLLTPMPPNPSRQTLQRTRKQTTNVVVCVVLSLHVVPGQEGKELKSLRSPLATEAVSTQRRGRLFAV